MKKQKIILFVLLIGLLMLATACGGAAPTNPGVVLAETDQSVASYSQSEYKDLPESVLDDMFDQACYVASPSEINVYKVLNSLESKRQFLYRFWKTLDKERPGWQEEYYDRVTHADQQWSSGSTPGWKTDRGRVYILYGEPSRYDRRPVGPNENPYEVWYYDNIEGGVEFDFVDITGFGEYRLVNSTKRGEISYPNWEHEYVYRH